MSPGQADKIITIGLFDSGVGGLSVLRHLERLALEEANFQQLRFIYLGDTDRCPYGNREASEIILFTKQIVDWLISSGANCIVMSCNTSAALASSAIRVRTVVPVHDLITPTAEHLAYYEGKVAVLATASTVRSFAFSRAIMRTNPKLDVLEIACPELVPMVESGQINSHTTKNVLWSYVKDFEAQGIQSVVLGCTHYPFLHELLVGMLPASIKVIDPAEQLVKSLKGFTNGSYESNSKFDVLDNPNNPELTKFYVTGSTASFAQVANICLGRELPNVNHLAIDDLIGVETNWDVVPSEINAVSPVAL